MNFISGDIVDGARPGADTHGRRPFVDGILYHCRCAVEQAVEADGRPQTAAHRLTSTVRWSGETGRRKIVQVSCFCLLAAVEPAVAADDPAAEELE